ncbi:hypothetical protein [Gordonia polyisoprenivorans]|uniref:hypothetical protein n=1 Tax=Gordonia polyisoprenivorans TaxID=84595 RepID=UPI0005BCAE92|nr:hypothetical protein [Gordonia polyisoprenivorans]
MRGRVRPGSVIRAGALGDRPDLLLGRAVTLRRRWGVRVVVDELGREWPTGANGVEVLEPNAFRLFVSESDGLRYPAVVPVAAVAVGLDGVSDRAEIAVDAVTGARGVGAGMVASQAVSVAPRTIDLDVANARGAPSGTTRERSLFHAASFSECSPQRQQG